MKKKKKNKDVWMSTYTTKFSVNDFTYNHVKKLSHLTKCVYNSYIYYANLYYKYKYFLIANYQDSEDFHVYCNNFFIKHKLLEEKILQVNDFLYHYLTDKYCDTIVTSKNFVNFYEKEKEETSEFNEIKDFKENPSYCIFVDQIIYRILRSFFYKNYYLLEDQMNCKKPFTIDDKDLQADVINKQHVGLNVSKENKDITVSDSTIIKKIVRLNMSVSENSLHCDIICTCLDKAVESYNSYWKLKEKGLKVQKPKFLRKDYFILTFNSNKNMVKNDKHICVNLGSTSTFLYPEFKVISRGQIVEEKYLVCKNGRKDTKKYYYTDDLRMIEKTNPNIISIRELKIPLFDRISGRNIRQIEIKINYYSRKLQANLTFETEKKSTNCTIDQVKPVSIDLGVKYLFSIYDYDKTPTILDAGYLNYLNHRYNYLIDNLKSHNKKVFNIDNSKLQSRLENNRKNKTDNIFRRVVNWFCDRYRDLNTLIVGYNKKWKEKVNLGKYINRKFYQIPYRKLLSMLKEKWERSGKRYVEINESYTSKCDALALEPVCHHKKYLGERERRGLFRSSTKRYIHADINASINIMRKYYRKEGLNFELKNTDKVSNSYNVALNQLD